MTLFLSPVGRKPALFPHGRRREILSPSLVCKRSPPIVAVMRDNNARETKKERGKPRSRPYSAVFLFFLAIGELIFQLDELLYLVEEGVDVLELAVHRGVTHICHVVHFAELFHDQFAYVF